MRDLPCRERGVRHGRLSYQPIDTVNWPFAHFYDNNLFSSKRLSNFVLIASAQGSKGNSAPPSEGLISLRSFKMGSPFTPEKPAKGQL